MMLQIFIYAFALPKRVPNTPAMPGKTLTKDTEAAYEAPEETTYFRKGTEKLLHMMRWSRPEIYN